MYPQFTTCTQLNIQMSFNIYISYIYQMIYICVISSSDLIAKHLHINLSTSFSCEVYDGLLFFLLSYRRHYHFFVIIHRLIVLVFKAAKPKLNHIERFNIIMPFEQYNNSNNENKTTWQLQDIHVSILGVSTINFNVVESATKQEVQCIGTHKRIRYYEVCIVNCLAKMTVRCQPLTIDVSYTTIPTFSSA